MTSTDRDWTATTVSANDAGKTSNTAPADNYALDDTLAGRIAQSAIIGVVTSYPDWIKNRTVLIGSYALSAAGFLGLVGYLNAQDEEDEDFGQVPDDAPTLPAWSIAAGVAVFALGAALDIAVTRRVAGWLRKRGVTKPWTLLGATGAALTFVVSEAEARQIARRAD